jgi:hypothetical protein
MQRMLKSGEIRPSSQSPPPSSRLGSKVTNTYCSGTHHSQYHANEIRSLGVRPHPLNHRRSNHESKCTHRGKQDDPCEASYREETFAESLDLVSELLQIPPKVLVSFMLSMASTRALHIAFAWSVIPHSRCNFS